MRCRNNTWLGSHVLVCSMTYPYDINQRWDHVVEGGGSFTVFHMKTSIICDVDASYFSKVVKLDQPLWISES